MTFAIETLAQRKKNAPGLFLVVGIEGSVKTEIYRTLTNREDVAKATMKNLQECEICRKQFIDGELGPRHVPSTSCLAGGKSSHCNCERCWRI